LINKEAQNCQNAGVYDWTYPFATQIAIHCFSLIAYDSAVFPISMRISRRYLELNPNEGTKLIKVTKVTCAALVTLSVRLQKNLSADGEASIANTLKPLLNARVRPTHFLGRNDQIISSNWPHLIAVSHSLRW
jgi:hypothetical protein